MRLLTGLLAITLILSATAADKVRVKSSPTATQYGTCFEDNGYLITCEHVVEHYKWAEVYRDGKWILCAVVKTHKVADIAWLKPVDVTLPPDSPPKLSECCLGNPEANLNSQEYPISEYSAPTVVECPGMDHGCSGSPVYRRGKLYGMMRGLVPAPKDKPQKDIMIVPIQFIRDNAPKSTK